MRTLFNLGERRANPFENPSVPLTDAGLIDWFGGMTTDSGVSVSEDSAMTFVAVWRCVSLLSGVIASLPLKAYRYSDKTEVIVRALRTPSSNGMTPFERWETVMAHLLLWGNAYVQKIRNQAGSIVELRPLHPSRVTPTLVGAQGPEQQVGKVFQIKGADNVTRPYTTFEIMHIPGLGYDGVRGLSPIGAAKQALGIGIAADRLAARLYGNGTLMSGVLSTDRILTQDQADTLKARWREKMTGLGHAHDIAVLDAGTKFTAVSMPPEEAQFLQTRRWQVVEIARLFGIPPHLVGDVEKSTSWGTGLEQQAIGMHTYVLRAWTARIEQRASFEITEPSTQYCEFLMDSMLRSDTLTRYQSYALGIMWGWMTRNEARAKENLQPIDGLDEPITPLSMSTSVMGETPIIAAGDSEPDDPNAGEAARSAWPAGVPDVAPPWMRDLAPA